MAVSFRSNPTSLHLQGITNGSIDQLAATQERLSSGISINRTGDDILGVTQSASVRHSRAINAKNTENGSHGTEILERVTDATSALLEVTANLYNIAAAATSYQISSSQRTALNTEAQNLRGEFDRITASASFNGYALLNGSYQNPNIQTSAKTSSADNIQLTFPTYGSAYISSLSLSSVASATTAADTLFNTYSAIAVNVASLQGQANRLGTAILNLATQKDALSVAEGRITSIDQAEEAAKLLKYQVLVDRGGAMEAQANLLPRKVLALLQ